MICSSLCSTVLSADEILEERDGEESADGQETDGGCREEGSRSARKETDGEDDVEDDVEGRHGIEK